MNTARRGNQLLQSYMFVLMCACVHKRWRERERERGKARKRERTSEGGGGEDREGCLMRVQQNYRSLLQNIVSFIRLFCNMSVWSESKREKATARESDKESTCACENTNANIRVCRHISNTSYGVATISRLHKIVGLFCRISPLL